MFGYGSLIWRPDLEYKERAIAQLPGFERRFWQGSHDHRGTPDAPGRVVTLVPTPHAVCTGVAYLIDGEVVRNTFEQLDHREKNGYERHVTPLQLNDGRRVEGLTYIAPRDNFAYLGEADLEDIAQQIAVSVGPSGRNVDYLLELAVALRELGTNDEHVFALESLVKRSLSKNRTSKNTQASG